jgi:hypothetical protein
MPTSNGRQSLSNRMTCYRQTTRLCPVRLSHWRAPGACPPPVPAFLTLMPNSPALSISKLPDQFHTPSRGRICSRSSTSVLSQWYASRTPSGSACQPPGANFVNHNQGADHYED